jgi:lipopolysaccharide transport system ATP-binding protein
MSSKEVVIDVRNLSKRYEIYNTPLDRLKQLVLPRLHQAANRAGTALRISTHQERPHYFHEFWALNDISFQVHRGETLGIIGRNGSGKSTLLQILAGTLTQTSGEANINGRIAALLELGSGFDPEFSGRENVFLNGQILGLTRKEIEASYDQIIEFADIGEFIDQPVKTYSSGMFVRLAFAVQAFSNPTLLIVDEALSVGDIFFQQKCFAFIRELQSKGTTIAFVSHDTNAVQNICDRAILLRNGRIEYDGLPEEAVSRYFAGSRQTNKSRASGFFSETNDGGVAIHPTAKTDAVELKNLILANNIIEQARSRHGHGGLNLIGATVLNHHGEPSLNVEMLGTARFIVLIQANSEVDEPTAGIHIYDRFNTLIFAAGTKQLRKVMPHMRPGDQVIVDFNLQLNIQAGEYTFSLGCSEPSPEGPNLGIVHDRLEGLGPVKVFTLESGVLPFYGIAQLPCEVGEVLFLSNQ